MPTRTPPSEARLIRVPKDGRISLARLGVQPNQRFRMDVHPSGTIILTPAKEDDDEDQGSLG